MLNKYMSAAAALLPPRVYGLMLVYFSVTFLLSGGNLSLGAYVLGALGLAAWCVNSTSTDALANFQAEQQSGRGNSEGAVLGGLKARHVTVLVIVSAVLALAFVAGFGFLALFAMLAALALTYVLAALPELTISRLRPGVVAALLPLGYVSLPMMLGPLAAGQLPSLPLLALMCFCYAQFALRLRSRSAFYSSQ